MHARQLAFSLAPLFAATAAHAQAPGEMVPVAAPEGACVAPCGCGPVQVQARESVMDNRWAIGLSVGSLSLAPDHQSDDKTAFTIGELALRFRATPHLELELSAGGGREQLDDHVQGDLEVNMIALAARYRFNPEGQWNWFLMGGLGGASVTLHDATQEERDDATHPLGMLGIGVERRFHHFALQAEARVVGIGEKHHDDSAMDLPVQVEPAMATVGTPPTTTSPGDRLGGGSITIGASYYF
ncbi:MAG TPA: outer membrane beta-barrel protein [Kofleriaceae bacterium]|nr:outer membrane beta-barrel protein [Kofleriaceae bacterium]